MTAMDTPKTAMKPATRAMVATKNSLPREKREQLAELLNARLADLVDLATQMKQAHWNVKGPSFQGLHELFDKATHEVREAVDLIAERAAQLGALVNGTARDAAANSTLPEYPHDIVSGQQHAEAAATALAAAARQVREAIDKSSELGDEGTADIFTEIVRDLDMYAWFVEAHTQADH